jgi:hypothetical protein
MDFFVEIFALMIPMMALSIPIIAILAKHRQEKEKIRSKMIEKQLELEKLKNENYLLETEKLRLELQKMMITDGTLEKMPERKD